jgi:hypothetical protein
MRFVLFLACLGGAYAIFIPLIGDGMAASAVAWPVCIGLYLVIRRSWDYWRDRRAERFVKPS